MATKIEHFAPYTPASEVFTRQRAHHALMADLPARTTHALDFYEGKTCYEETIDRYVRRYHQEARRVHLLDCLESFTSMVRETMSDNLIADLEGDLLKLINSYTDAVNGDPNTKG